MIKYFLFVAILLNRQAVALTAQECAAFFGEERRAELLTHPQGTLDGIYNQIYQNHFAMGQQGALESRFDQIMNLPQGNIAGSGAQFVNDFIAFLFQFCNLEIFGDSVDVAGCRYHCVNGNARTIIGSAPQIDNVFNTWKIKVVFGQQLGSDGLMHPILRDAYPVLTWTNEECAYFLTNPGRAELLGHDNQRLNERYNHIYERHGGLGEPVDFTTKFDQIINFPQGNLDDSGAQFINLFIDYLRDNCGNNVVVDPVNQNGCRYRCMNGPNPRVIGNARQGGNLVNVSTIKVDFINQNGNDGVVHPFIWTAYPLHPNFGNLI